MAFIDEFILVFGKGCEVVYFVIQGILHFASGFCSLRPDP